MSKKADVYAILISKRIRIDCLIVLPFKKKDGILAVIILVVLFSLPLIFKHQALMETYQKKLLKNLFHFAVLAHYRSYNLEKTR